MSFFDLFQLLIDVCLQFFIDTFHCQQQFGGQAQFGSNDYILMFLFPAFQQWRDRAFAARTTQRFTDAVDGRILAVGCQLGRRFGDMRIVNSCATHNASSKYSYILHDM